jgi:hypothetical protein
MTDCSALVSGLLPAAAQWSIAVLAVTALFLLSPNTWAFVVHGTPDLLLADGYTMEQWIAERRQS